MHFHTLFHLYIFLQMFSNNNFQFLNTCTKRVLNMQVSIPFLYLSIYHLLNNFLACKLNIFLIVMVIRVKSSLKRLLMGYIWSSIRWVRCHEIIKNIIRALILFFIFFLYFFYGIFFFFFILICDKKYPNLSVRGHPIKLESTQT